MKRETIEGFDFFYDQGEEEEARLIGRACAAAIPFLRERLGINPPEDCRIYVLTSCTRFLLHAAPWYQRPALFLMLPFYLPRIKRIWEQAGGWNQRFGRRCAVGIKPPRLLRQGPSAIGARLFVQEENLEEKIRHIACHELTHAFTAHLKPPMWFHEGLAMLMVDRFLGRETVQRRTLDLLERREGPDGYEQTRQMNEEAIIASVAKGYWISRFLEEAHGDLLKDLLAGPRPIEESRLAAGLGIPLERFWQEILGLALPHFRVNPA